MKDNLRVAALTSATYTLIIGFLLWQAFFGRTPNDAGMTVFLSAFPTSLLAESSWHLREPIAAALHQPVTDRLAMSLDAVTGWLVGCIQYSVLAVLGTKIARARRRATGHGA
jgi:hypothetical protein